MVEVNIGAAERGTFTKEEFTIPAKDTDGATNADETYYQNTKWPQWHAYYKKIPELKQAIDAKSRWTMGKGYKADPITTLILDRITGWGKDTFNTILENMIKVMNISGDAYAEIITDEDGFLLNLKPLDPGSMKIVADPKGILKRYEQMSKVKDAPSRKFAVEDIFHLSKDRVADEIHGVSVVEAVEEIILMRNEAMTDWKKVLHRNIEPMIIWHLETDDPQRIKEFKNLREASIGSGQNLYIPKGAVIPEIVSVSQQQVLNPIQWIDNLNQYFYSAVGVPDIVLGTSKVLTEASAKIAFMAFGQTVEEDQLYVEEQVLAQLNLLINLEQPVKIENELLQSQSAEVNSPELQTEPLAQPNELQAGVEGRT